MFLINEVSKRTGASQRSIRLWEDRGLLGEVERDRFMNRQYTGDHVERIKAILAAQSLHYNLDETHELMKNWPVAKIGIIRHLIAKLQVMVKELENLLDQSREYDL